MVLKGGTDMRIIWIAAGFAAGYVMGSKAGRERYEQIRRTASDFMHTPVVHDAQAKVKDLAERGAEAVATKVGLSSSKDSVEEPVMATPQSYPRPAQIS